MRTILLCTILVVLFISTGCATNPITGKNEFMLLTEEQDIEIGKTYAPEIEKQMGGKIIDVDMQNYINSTGQKVAGVSHRPDFDYEFVALDHNSINALALPGGRIFITRGLLEKLDSEAQLASVLAHETAHVVARDTAAAISRDIGISIVLAAASSEGASGTVMTVADVTTQMLGLSYSREDEKVADLAGLDYMVMAGYNPFGMVETMKMLEEENESRPIEFFSTHPSPENRIEYISEKIILTYLQPETLKAGKEDYETFVLNRLD